MLQLLHVGKTYSDGNTEYQALKDITVTLPSQGMVAIIGESGAGKSTLLNLLGKIDTPSTGKILLNGEDTGTFTQERQESFYQFECSFIYQNYNLFEKMTPRQNIAMPLLLRGWTEQECTEKTNQIAERVGIQHLLDKQCSDLSGGEKQRVAIARACVKNNHILLADEPTGNLDHENSSEIFKLLQEFSEHMLVVVVTHNREMAETYADYVMWLFDGRIKEFIENEGHIVPADVQQKEPESTEKKIHLRSKLWFAAKLLRQRKKRIVLTTVIFTIIFFMCFCVAAVAGYNATDVVAKYLEDNNVKDVALVLKADNPVSQINEADVRSGLYLKQKTEDVVADNLSVDVCRIAETELSTSGPVASYDERSEQTEVFRAQVRVVIIYDDDEIWGKESVGVVPKAIVPNKLGELLGKSAENGTFWLGGIETIIVCSDSLQELLRDETFLGLTETIEGNKYDQVKKYQYTVYVNNAWADAYADRDNCLYLEANDIRTKVPFNYAYRGLTIGNASLLSTEKHILNATCGVILSQHYAETMDLWSNTDVDDIVGRQVSLMDLYDPKQFGKAQTGKINLYTYFGEHIVIEDIIEDGEADIYVDEAVFRKILNDYREVFAFQLGIRNTKNEWNHIASSIHKEGMHIDDVLLQKTYDLESIKPKLAPYLIITVILFAVLVVALFISLVTFTINDNRPNIGVLQTLGMRQRDVESVFATEAILVLSIAVLISGTAYFVTVSYVRQKLTEFYGNWCFCPVTWGLKSFGMTFLLIVIICLLLVACTMRRMRRETIRALIQTR